MRAISAVALLLLVSPANAEQKLLISNAKAAERYLQGYDVSDSAVVIVSMQEHSFLNDFNAYLSAVPGKTVDAHISEPERLMYEWNTQSGTRIFSGTPPPWYANPNHPRDQIPTTKVYGTFGVLLDDSNKEGSGRFQTKYLHQQRLFQQTQNQIMQRRDELQKKVESGQVDLGMSEFEVLAVWGEPTLKSVAGGKTIYIYENGWTVFFEKGVAIETLFEKHRVRR